MENQSVFAMAGHGVGIDPRSGYCQANSIYYSKRRPLSFPTDEYLDLPSFLSSRPHKGKVAFVDASTGKQISYSEFWSFVKSVAVGLSDLGVRKGDVVLILSPNSIHFPVICMAIMSIGAVITTTNPVNTATEIAKQARDSKAILAFVTPNLAEKLLPANLPFVVISGEKQGEIEGPIYRNRVSSLEKLIASNPDRMHAVKIRQDDTATLLHSSGTTGMSKGAISTHRNLISMASIWINKFRLTGENATANSFLCTLPMFHVGAFSLYACALVGSGSTVVVLPKYDMVDMLEAIQKYRVRSFVLVPPILLDLTNANVATNYNLSSLRTVVCSAAPLSKESTLDFLSEFPGVTLMQCYGMTETSAIGASTDTEEESRRYGTAGRLSPNTEAKIVDPVSGTALPPNQRGELWLRGPTVMKGYFSNPESTTSTLDSEGWLRTGDLCYIDDEGYIFVVDRLKELIKYKGYQVAPAELEALLLSHHEIADAAVIPHPDKAAGQIPVAYIVKKPGSTLSGASIIDFVAHQVAPYKKIRQVMFVNVIPKNAAGKILRKDLIKLVVSKL